MTIKSNVFSYLIFLIGAILITFENITYCSIFFDLGFDGQHGVLWNYTLASGLLPYRDIFYPYGILSYYSQYNFITNLIPYFLYLAVIHFFFYFIKKIFLNKIIAIFLGWAFVLFLEVYTGAYLVNRYGVVLLFGLFCIDFVLQKKPSLKVFVLFGFINGLMYGLLGDPGIYSGILFTAITIFSSAVLLRKNSIKQVSINCMKNIIAYSLGFLIGVLPFILYLIFTDSVSAYITFLRDISYLLPAWKTPLTPFLNSPDNIFTFFIFYISSLYISIKLVTKKKLTATDSYQIVLLVFILLLEQKSLIKSIDRQITFVSFFLSLILVSELLTELKKNAILWYYRYVYLFLFLFFILVIYPFAKRPFLQKQEFNFFNENLNKVSECIEANKESITKSTGAYSNERLLSFISSQKSFYSFPGEPVWYVLGGVMPPKYVDTYVSSYKDIEEYRLEYLKNQKPEYLLYNFARFAFIDGVPDYMRVPNELKFLLTHYIPLHKEEETLVMRRSGNSVDFFQNELVKNDPVISKNLLSVSLGNIPRSEGSHKLESDRIFDFTNILRNNNSIKFNSQGKILLVKHKKTEEEFSAITMKTREGFETKIEYMNCDKEICVINLDRVPLFYLPREITSIEFNIKQHSGYSLINNDKVYKFW